MALKSTEMRTIRPKKKKFLKNLCKYDLKHEK